MTLIERRGKLVVWKDDKGFGFIQPEDKSGRVFLHISAVRSTQRRPQEGDSLLYQISTGADGKLRAINASILGLGTPAKPLVHIQVGPPIRQPILPIVTAQRLPVWLEIGLLSALPLVGSAQFLLVGANPLPLGLYLGMGLVAFFAYREDKSRARNNRRRIPEKNLHLLELGGGWLGGFVAQRWIRHKNRKSSYQAVFWSIVVLHQVGWMVWLATAGGLGEALTNLR